MSINVNISDCLNRLSEIDQKDIQDKNICILGEESLVATCKSEEDDVELPEGSFTISTSMNVMVFS